MQIDLEGGEPNKATLRLLLLQAVGEARARGITGHDALLDAAQAAVARWADSAAVTVDLEQARRRMLALAGGPDARLWSEPIPPREALPEDLAALVEYAWRSHEACLWAEDIDRAADPRVTWPAVARALRERGSPDPKAWWLAEAIETAAVTDEGQR